MFSVECACRLVSLPTTVAALLIDHAGGVALVSHHAFAGGALDAEVVELVSERVA